jgi:hypothetical protein
MESWNGFFDSFRYHKTLAFRKLYLVLKKSLREIVGLYKYWGLFNMAFRKGHEDTPPTPLKRQKLEFQKSVNNYWAE